MPPQRHEIPVFQGNGRLRINVLNHEQADGAPFAGMTGMAMEERFHQPCWQKRAAGPPVLNGALAGLEGAGQRGSTKHKHASGVSGGDQNIIPSRDGHGLIYFKRRFHPVRLEMEAPV